MNKTNKQILQGLAKMSKLNEDVIFTDSQINGIHNAIDTAISEYNKENHGKGVDIYVDRRDIKDLENNKREINDILDSKNPEQAFQDSIFDWYSSAEVELRIEIEDQILNRVVEILGKDGFEVEQEDIREDTELAYYLENEINTEIGINYPEEELKNGVDVDMILQIKNSTFNHSANTIEDIKKNKGIKFLVESQKYKFEDFLEFYSKRLDDEKFETENKFFKSLFTELENVNYESEASLTFAARTTLGDAMDICSKSTKTIRCSKECICGFFDQHEGSGGPLEIYLREPVIVNKSDVEVGPDGFNGYSIQETYGLTSGAWSYGNMIANT